MFGSPAHSHSKLPIQGEGWTGMGDAISRQAVLEVVGEFDECGGASIGLVAWELCTDEWLVARAWEQAKATGLIAPTGHDQHEQLWRLTPAGWAAHHSKRESA